MASYRAVIWFAGEDAAPALDPARRALVSSYLGSGGRLFLSGADLLGSIDDELGATHVADGTGYEVRVEAGGLFFDLGPLSFADFGAGSYDAERPDVLAPADGAASELTYADGAVAATSLDNRVIVFGFPFETLLGEQTRVEVMARILSTFEIEPESPGTDSGGCGCRSGGQNQRGGLEFLLLAVAILARCRRRT
jgi:hypothetical protein